MMSEQQICCVLILMQTCLALLLLIRPGKQTCTVQTAESKSTFGDLEGRTKKFAVLHI
uniref:Uncharacterized protein n=1 Tax=Arundo donax TaxID=35708 RepID=A0A0A9ACX8_ARUDO